MRISWEIWRHEKDISKFTDLADRHGQRDRGVQVASGHPARDKNAQHDSDAKAPIDAEKVPRSTFAEYRLGYWCIAEHLYEHRS